MNSPEIAEHIRKPFTTEELTRHEEQLKDWPDAQPTLQILERYLYNLRSLLEEREQFIKAADEGGYFTAYWKAHDENKKLQQENEQLRQQRDQVMQDWKESMDTSQNLIETVERITKEKDDALKGVITGEYLVLSDGVEVEIRKDPLLVIAQLREELEQVREDLPGWKMENAELRSELKKKNIVLNKVPELIYADSPNTAAELCKIILQQYKT